MSGGHKLNIKQRSRPRYPGHPLTLREGQIYMPLFGRTRANRQRMIVTRLEIADGTAFAKREEAEDLVPIKANRVLETTTSSQEWPVGKRYRFCGWLSRPRGYPTSFEMVEVDVERSLAMIRIPEWDPRVTFNEPLSQFPISLRWPGAIGWLRADLAAREPSKLQVHDPRAGEKVFGIPYRPVLHPSEIHVGQRFRRKNVERSRRSILRVVELDGEKVLLRSETNRRRIPVTVASLLRTRRDGTGLNYEYVGGSLRATEESLRQASLPTS